MATRIGDLFFGVTADTSQAQAQIDRFASTAGKTLSSVGDTLAKTIGTAVGVAVVGMSALTYETLQAGIAYNTLGQSATAAFSTIYESSEAAYGILQQISQLDLTSPFTGSSLIAVSRTLAGFGVAEQDIIGLTTALSEATAAMGLGSEALERMALAFGQIQSRGKLAGDEARQLANYGIDAYGLLADKLGLSVAAVRELGQEGKLAADFVLPTLVEAIEERFGGAGEALFQTFAGQVEGLRSIMEAVGSALIDPLIGFNSGGALVGAFDEIRTALLQFVQVGEGGAYELTGALEPLADLMERIAGVVERAGAAIGGWLDSLDESSIPNLLSELEGLEPLLAGIAVAAAAAFTSTIPIIGPFIAQFAGLPAIITAVVVSSGELRSAVADGFRSIVEAAEPLVPLIQDFGVALVNAVEEVGPAAIDVVVSAFDALVPILEEVIPLATQLLDVFGPTLALALEGIADAFKVIGEAIEFVGPEAVILAAALVGLPALLTLVSTAATLVAAQITSIGVAVASTTALIPALLAGLLTLGAAKTIEAGVSGDLDYLNRDVPIYEKPFQIGGRVGFELVGGDRDLIAQTAELNRLLEEGEKIGDTYADAMRRSGLSMDEFAEQAMAAGLPIEAVNFALIRYREILNEIDAERVTDLWEAYGDGTDLAVAAFGRVADAQTAFNEELIQETDLLKQLQQEADAAWEALDRFANVNPGAGIDDFLRSLPSLGEELTDALEMDEGIFRDLNIRGVTDEIRTNLVNTIVAAAKELGLTLQEVQDLFNKQGLQGVLEDLGLAAEMTAEKIDPIVQQYKALDASAEELHDAVRSLEDQRTTRIRAEIDQLEAALRDAEDAATRAREELINLFTGGYQNSAQQLLDDLIGNIDSIGSRIEDALMTGGVLGDAALRSALGDFNSQIASIIQAGIEEGLSPQQIIDMLGPLGAALQQVLGMGADRIVTFDWESGITPAAAAELSAALNAALANTGGLDAAIASIINADAAVASIQAQLDAKQAELQMEVVFSPEQVQAELDRVADLQAEVQLDVSPEAQREIQDLVEEVFADKDFEVAIDKANITQDILDAALQAQDDVTLKFVSGVTFDRDQLAIAADALGEDFAFAFNAALKQWAEEQNMDYSDVASRGSLEPLTSNTSDVNVGGEIKVTTDVNVNPNGTQTSATSTISKQSVAASSGGRVNTYGPGVRF